MSKSSRNFGSGKVMPPGTRALTGLPPLQIFPGFVDELRGGGGSTFRTPPPGACFGVFFLNKGGLGFWNQPPRWDPVFLTNYFFLLFSYFFFSFFGARSIFNNKKSCAPRPLSHRWDPCEHAHGTGAPVRAVNRVFVAGRKIYENI